MQTYSSKAETSVVAPEKKEANARKSYNFTHPLGKKRSEKAFCFSTDSIKESLYRYLPGQASVARAHLAGVAPVQQPALAL